MSDQLARIAEGNVVGDSDRSGQLVEGFGDATMVILGVDAKFVVPASQVLHERVTTNDNSGGTVALLAAHRTQPRLQAPVVTLDPIVRILLSVVEHIEGLGETSVDLRLDGRE